MLATRSPTRPHFSPTVATTGNSGRASPFFLIRNALPREETLDALISSLAVEHERSQPCALAPARPNRSALSLTLDEHVSKTRHQRVWKKQQLLRQQQQILAMTTQQANIAAEVHALLQQRAKRPRNV